MTLWQASATRHSPHTLRHSFATRNAEREGLTSIPVRGCGTRIDSLTQIYTHLSFQRAPAITATHIRGPKADYEKKNTESVSLCHLTFKKVCRYFSKKIWISK